ncbi:unnamed protein product [Staurois parvus]|uniref:MHC class I antigen n=1 Tax=Staurois parvus TaxID=386267 RepID=A0ABN9EHB4_9NEOB|nr:unnamed protein product [Staurois parvus]
MGKPVEGLAERVCEDTEWRPVEDWQRGVENTEWSSVEGLHRRGVEDMNGGPWRELAERGGGL